MRTQGGFTLIELLVVVSIIGMLSSVVLASLNGAREKARDVRRLSDMNQIVTANELYHSDNGTYSYSPDEVGAPCSWDASSDDKDGDGKPFIEPLEEGGYIAPVPVDPLDPGSGCGGYTYRYYHYTGGYGCNGNYYVLSVRDMETSDNPHPNSPGFSCNVDFTSGNPLSTTCIGGGTHGVDCRNWQFDVDWVTGGFD